MALGRLTECAYYLDVSARLMSRLPVSGMVTVRPENLKLVYLAGTAYSKRAGWLGFAKHNPAKREKATKAWMPARSRCVCSGPKGRDSSAQAIGLG